MASLAAGSDDARSVRMSEEIPRYAEKPGPTVNHVLQFARVETVVVDQMDEHTGIKGAAACPHHQAIDSREAHCACNAASAFYCAEARAISEMRDNDTAIRNFRGDCFRVRAVTYS